MNKKKTISLIILSVFFLVSCSHQVLINTNPSGAKVIINGDDYGESPVFFSERTGNTKQYPIRIEKEGYKPLAKNLSQTEYNEGCLIASVAGTFFCLFPVFGIIWSKQLRDSYLFTLEPEKSSKDKEW